MDRRPEAPLRVLVLYSRLTGYFKRCLDDLSTATGAVVHVVARDEDHLAPFDLPSTDGVTVHARSALRTRALLALCSDLDPDVVLVSGWRDPGYLAVALRARFDRRVTVLCLDNQWAASPRQRAAVLASPLSLAQIFSHAWVPGPRQAAFAERLGFAAGRVHRGLYVADLPLFAIDEVGSAERFVFAGRLVPAKGVDRLAAAYQQYRSRGGVWPLQVVGRGPDAGLLDGVPGVEMLGFLQPAALAEFGVAGGCFVLPSRFEPWGLVVHEFAAMGYSLLLSDAVGAGDVFLEPGSNGAIGNGVSELASDMTEIAELSASERQRMGRVSADLASQINHRRWNETICSMARTTGRGGASGR